jgi:hypothetical protein
MPISSTRDFPKGMDLRPPVVCLFAALAGLAFVTVAVACDSACGEQPAPQPSDASLAAPRPPRLSVPVASLIVLALLPAFVLYLRRRGAARRTCDWIVAVFLGGVAALWPYGRWECADPFAHPPPLTDEQAATVFAALHAGVYRAFDGRSEDDVYEALEQAVDGPLLRELYLQIRRGLEMQEHEGAVARVQEVKILESRRLPRTDDRPQDRRGFDHRVRWTVTGTVEHWGHVHTRTNVYEAQFTMEPRGSVWKITGLEVLHEDRLPIETRLREAASRPLRQPCSAA